MNANLEPSQNPYRAPLAVDGGDGIMPPGRRRGARDLALVGLFLGTSYGAATGAATTVSLSAVHTLVQFLQASESLSVSGRPDLWITYYVAVAVLGAALGAFSGAVLGPLQGVLTARRPPTSLPQLRRFAAFSWASAATAWCLRIDQSALSAAPQTWMLYLALLVATSAAGLGGSLTASRLARVAWDWQARR